MTLSILIVNWNSQSYLRQCLGSIRRTCAGLAPQVVVVDGGSYDGCAEMLALEFPEVVFVQSPENIGFGRANNVGFVKATGEALLLLNPDTEVQPGAVECLLDKLSQLPEAGMVGARLLNADASLQLTSVHHLPTAWNAAVDSEWVRRRWWRRKGPTPDATAQEVEAVSGACMMLRAETFRGLSGFDPRYFMYAEDMDLCFKIRRAGWKIYHVPRAQVIHYGGGSSRTQFSKFSVVMLHEALRVYILSNYGRFHALLYRLLMAISAALRILILFMSRFLTTGDSRVTRWASITKWWTVLSWSMGMETWTRRWYGYHNAPLAITALKGGQKTHVR
ncbi:MAG: glycosyltransferase family 2 protein [Verrucomicrobiota bacterium]